MVGFALKWFDLSALCWVTLRGACSTRVRRPEFSKNPRFSRAEVASAWTTTRGGGHQYSSTPKSPGVNRQQRGWQPLGKTVAGESVNASDSGVPAKGVRVRL